MKSVKPRTTITIDDDNVDWLRQQPNVSAYVNQLVRLDRQHQLEQAMRAGSHRLDDFHAEWD